MVARALEYTGTARPLLLTCPPSRSRVWSWEPHCAGARAGACSPEHVSRSPEPFHVCIGVDMQTLTASGRNTLFRCVAQELTGEISAQVCYTGHHSHVWTAAQLPQKMFLRARSC